MKKTLILLLVIAFIACNQQQKPKTDAPKEVKQYTIEQFFETISIFGGSFSPDETKLLVTSNESGIYNVYSMPIDGSEKTQLTDSETDYAIGLTWFPADERFLYTSDQGGNEINHVYVRNEDGTSEDLTPYEGARSSFYGWARDQRSFFYVCNQRDQRFMDLYEMDVAGFGSEMIYENTEGLDVGAISKNKRYLALTKDITTSNNEMYLFDRETKELKNISEHEGDASFSPQYFSLDDGSLYFLSDENDEFTYLMKYDLESGEKEKIYKADWDVWYAYESWNGKYRVIGINEDAKTVIHVFDLDTGEEIDFPEFEEGDITSVGISKSEEQMRFYVGSSTSPSNLYIYNFETKEYKQLTNTLNPEIDQEDLVMGQVVRYPSFDGLEIPSIYFPPHNASKDNKVPALVWVHGGPGGQSRLGYSSLMQYFVNHGYAVIAVNNRGSSGYGKTFYKMDDRGHGDVDLKDCVKAKDFLASTGVIDMDKIGIIGGSYGGYMVMAALAFEPEAFDVGVNIFGVTNWLRTLNSIPPYWESFREALYAEMGDPTTEDSVRLYNISPLFHAENVVRPLMVLQGANDPRVLQVESDEIVAAVEKNGVPVEYVLFDDEGHGFMKKENEIEGYGKVLKFLDAHLK